MNADSARAAPAGLRLPKQQILNVVGLVAVVTVLSYAAWLRLPEVTRATIWAEDGHIFLRETATIGPWRSIGEPYAGYLHTIPRFISAISYVIAPLESYAILMSFLTCVVVAGISVAVFRLSTVLFESRAARLMLALIPVFLPVGPLEVSGNAANLHWYILWLVPWLLIYEPSRWHTRAVIALAAFAAATTEIISGIFLPLALWAIFRRKNYAGALGLIAGLFCQLLATATKPRYTTVPQVDGIDPLSVFYGFGLQVISSLWETNPKTLALYIVNFGAYPIVIPALVVTCLVLYILILGNVKWKFVAAYSLGAAVLAWSAAVMLNVSPELDFASFTKDDWLNRFALFRYAAAPSMFLLILIPAAWAVARERAKTMPLKESLWPPVLLLIFLSINYFPAMPTRQSGPVWADGVAVAREQCAADVRLNEVSIALAPANWYAALPCPVILRHSR